MARAKSAPRQRGTLALRTSGRSRRSPARGRPEWVDTYVLQWHSLGIAILVIAIALLPWRSAFATLGLLRDAIVQTTGYGAFFLVIAFGAVGVLLLSGRFALSLRGLRWTAGAACGALAVLGFLAFLHPEAELAGVSLRTVSAGGALGRWLTGSAPGVAVWLASWFGFSFAYWPRHTRAFFCALPPSVVALWRLDLHGRAWRAAQDLRRSFDLRELPVDTLADVRIETEAAEEGEEAPAVSSPAETAPRAPLAAALSAQAPPERAVPHRPSPWQLPPLGLLAPADSERMASDNTARARLIVDTLASFGVDAQVVQVNQGPTVTQFGIEPGWEVKTRTTPEKDARGKPVLDKDGNPKFRTEEVSRTRVRVNQITALANDLALALAAPSIRIEAPVPGKPVVGIEVPNQTASVVRMRSVIETATFRKLAERSKLALALGAGVSGEPVAADLGRMPHLLIAGATGAGKSVCINAIVACILTHATPDEVRFVMIDPKRVELAAFGSIPHLALSKVIVDVEEVVSTLGAVVREMESRYKRFEQLGVRNLEAYNRHPKVTARLPFWVVIIDELADLMMAVPYEVERQICRLAQLARATGIHLVVATQRPSVDVVTGLIKANFPTRIAFAVSSQVDSRTILDTVGAEKLLGRGDMLFLATDAAKPRRLQGVFVSDQEIESLVNFWTSERWEQYRPPTYDHLIEEAKAEQEREEQLEDPLLEKAIELAQEHSRISASMLQRRLRIGYPRAARLMDELEEAGIVGGAESGQSREVLAGEHEGI
jgi:DNA segregation ATPase FtsK/SpoIIIE-like protein